MNHPDFRLGGKVFASLGYPDDEHGMVSLTPDQQGVFLKKAPSVFSPCAGMLGKRGPRAFILPIARGHDSGNRRVVRRDKVLETWLGIERGTATGALPPRLLRISWLMRFEAICCPSRRRCMQRV